MQCVRLITAEMNVRVRCRFWNVSGLCGSNAQFNQRI